MEIARQNKNRAAADNVPKTPASEVTFSFVDIETTGCAYNSGDRVCEVAVLLTRAGQKVDSYSQLINPCRPIPPNVTQMCHGITDDMVRDMPRFEQIASKLSALISGTAVVCHNAEFDVPFLSSEFMRAGMRFPPVVVLDTLKYARKHGKFKSNRLGNITLELGFSSDGWHRALNDVMMTERVFSHFVKQFSTEGEVTLAELFEYQTGGKKK
jgi:DNA polymerase III epsilon subunit family exonuclease